MTVAAHRHGPWTHPQHHHGPHRHTRLPFRSHDFVGLAITAPIVRITSQAWRTVRADDAPR
jgi:hypothetical protein